VVRSNSIELAVLANVVGFPRTHEREAAVTWPVIQPTSRARPRPRCPRVTGHTKSILRVGAARPQRRPGQCHHPRRGHRSPGTTTEPGPLRFAPSGVPRRWHRRCPTDRHRQRWSDDRRIPPPGARAPQPRETPVRRRTRLAQAPADGGGAVQTTTAPPPSAHGLLDSGVLSFAPRGSYGELMINLADHQVHRRPILGGLTNEYNLVA
jgi:hypothetical protein